MAARPSRLAGTNEPDTAPDPLIQAGLRARLATPAPVAALPDPGHRPFPEPPERA